MKMLNDRKKFLKEAKADKSRYDSRTGRYRVVFILLLIVFTLFVIIF